MIHRRTLLEWTLAGATSALMGSGVRAQSGYPSRPVRLVVPFAAGGLVDIIGRMWADKAQGPLGTVVVENIGGAGGAVGAAAVARAEPDGYMLLLGNSSTQILAPATMRKAPYDPAKDFVAVSILCQSATSIVVNPSLPVKTLQDLITYAKANPGKVSYGSAGAGTMTNLAGEMFKQLAGIPDMVHVPYKGAAPALTDVIAGHVPVVTPNITVQLLRYHEEGKLRILSVNAPARLAAAPDIPTSEEAGLKGMDLQVFTGLFAPAGTPLAIVERLATATRAVKQDPSFQAALTKSGFEPVEEAGPKEAQRYVDDEARRLAPIIKSAGMAVGK